MKHTLALVLIPLAVLILYGCKQHLSPEDWSTMEKALLSLALFFGTVFSACIVSVLLHESAHAITGLLTGYRVAQYAFWFPCPTTYWRWGQTWFIFGARFGGGGWCVLYPKKRNTGRGVWSTAAGPMTDLVFMIALWSLCWIFKDQKILGGYLFIAALYATVTFLISLHPHRSTIAGDYLSNDMALILEELKSKETNLLYYAIGLYRRHEYAEAERVLRENPDKDEWRLSLADCLSAQGKHIEALSIYRTYLSHEEYGPYVKNTMAWILATSQSDRDLERADRLSQEVLALDPAHPHFKGTRGTVLLMMGKRDEARPLLSESFDQHLEPDAKGKIAASLGWLEFESGNADLAARYLKRALYFHPESWWVVTLKRRLES